PQRALDARPALHSFPTRRSSDLRGEGAPLVNHQLRGPGRGREQDSRRKTRQSKHHVFASFLPLRTQRRAAVLSRITKSPLVRLRSEEHTSELQSRFDLVCRLLLE